MKIAVIGPGGIGSTFAFQLARAGHEVTVVARGKRLEQLQRDQAVITRDGQRATVRVTSVLDETTPWDLLLVTVLASQVDALLPALRASAARQVMFMFNTFEPLGRLRDAVGAARFAFGFPAKPYALAAHVALLEESAPGAPWMIAGLAVDIRPLIAETVARGGHVRVGLEDAPLGSSMSNLAWVEAAVRLVRDNGAEPASGSDVRNALQALPATA